MNTLNYKGFGAMLFDTAKTVGPDMDGGFYRPISATYNDKKDMTTILFEPVPPSEWTPEMVLVRSKQMSNRDRIEFIAASLNPNRRHFSHGITTARPADQTGSNGSRKGKRASRQAHRRDRRGHQ